MDPSKRLDIHLRHYEASLTAAVVGRFPATVWLIGARRLEQAARRFVHEHPPTAPCIAEYGAAFPTFLGSWPDTAHLTYAPAFANGSMIFPAIYVYALYAHLPGAPAVRGTAWGLVLWLVAQTVVMPMMGAGLFSSAMGGGMAAMGSLIGHVLYGSLLGNIASAPEPRVAHA